MTPDQIKSSLDSTEQLIRAAKYADAEALLRQILAQEPNQPEALARLAYILHGNGQYDEAEKTIRRVISLEPNRPDHICNLAVILTSQGRYDEAMDICRKLIARRPDIGEAYDNLARTLRLMHKLDQATATYRQGISAAPKYVPNYVHLAEALFDKGEPHESLAAARQALVIQPDHAEAYYQIGYVLKAIWRLDESIVAYEKAVALRPNYADALLNLGIVKWLVGEAPEACDLFRRSVAANGRDGYAHSNLILTMHYRDDCTPDQIAAELRAWNKNYAEPQRNFIRPLTNDRSPDRPLRIGYVSPDFRGHPVGRFMAPLLAHHDRRRFQIHCFSDIKKPDAMTERLRKSCDVWHHIEGMPHSTVADLIRNDQIDILVDLTLHTERHRLLVFAQKPAPVQVTYLGYCGSSGLSTMDWRLSDPYFDPPGADESGYSEKTYRLPKTYWTFEPLDIMPEFRPPPSQQSGQITFGSFNNYCKVTPSVWNTWANILAAVPNSRLFVFTGDGPHRDAIRSRFATQGIDPNRLAFNANVPMRLYFASYHKVDIALDPFPFGGGATTCDALWMGVPVITLKGQLPTGRAGSSILNNVGLPELIAETPDHYVQIAKDLSANPQRLAQLRQTLRPRMQASPLMDAPAFARDVEKAYRHMWQTFCAQK